MAPPFPILSSRSSYAIGMKSRSLMMPTRFPFLTTGKHDTP